MKPISLIAIITGCLVMAGCAVKPLTLEEKEQVVHSSPGDDDDRVEHIKWITSDPMFVYIRAAQGERKELGFNMSSGIMELGYVGGMATGMFSTGGNIFAIGQIMTNFGNVERNYFNTRYVDMWRGTAVLNWFNPDVIDPLAQQEQDFSFAETYALELAAQNGWSCQITGYTDEMQYTYTHGAIQKWPAVYQIREYTCSAGVRLEITNIVHSREETSIGSESIIRVIQTDYTSATSQKAIEGMYSEFTQFDKFPSIAAIGCPTCAGRGEKVYTNIDGDEKSFPMMNKNKKAPKS